MQLCNVKKSEFCLKCMPDARILKRKFVFLCKNRVVFKKLLTIQFLKIQTIKRHRREEHFLKFKTI